MTDIHSWGILLHTYAAPLASVNSDVYASISLALPVLLSGVQVARPGLQVRLVVVACTQTPQIADVFLEE